MQLRLCDAREHHIQKRQQRAVLRDGAERGRGERLRRRQREIFALERQNEETKKGFDTGMAVAKRQIKMLEEMLDEAKKAQ